MRGTLVGIVAGLLAAYATYLIVVRPIQRSRAIPQEETEIFILTGTLLWGIMIQVGMAYLFTDNPVTMRPLIAGVVNILGVRTPRNEIMIAVLAGWSIGLLWLLVNRTRTGKRLLAASINPRGADPARLRAVAHLPRGLDDLGLLAGLAGVLLASFFGVSSDQCRRADRQRLLDRRPGRARQRAGSLIAAYVVGYMETITAYLIAPTLRPIRR